MDGKNGCGEGERDIMADVRLEASRKGFTLWRNNVGTGWVGRRVAIPAGTTVLMPGGGSRFVTDRPAVLLIDPRPLHAGLCVGSSDLIGFRKITVTQDMVGSQIPVFAAIEVKTKTGSRRKEQKIFLDFVKNAGCVSLVARGAEDLGP